MGWTTVNAYHPSREEKKDYLACQNLYTYECWVPESVAGIGDTYFFWDMIIDVPVMYRDYCENNKKVSRRRK